MPLYVIAYKKSKVIGVSLLICAIVCQIVYAILESFANNFVVGVLFLEIEYINSIIIDKPYARVGSHAVGVIFALLYESMLRYRKLRRATRTKLSHIKDEKDFNADVEKVLKQTYPKTHFFIGT